MIPRGIAWGGMVQDPLSRATHYRQEAAKCYELAKSASPGFLRECYRRVAAQYLFLAEDELKLVEQPSRPLKNSEKSWRCATLGSKRALD
jgi:hypothetical protein